MTGASVLFSMKDGFAKCLGASYPVLEILWIQYSAMLIIFMPIVFIKYGWANLMPKSPRAQLMRGIYAVSAVGLFYLALTDIPLADATALIFITPIVVTILSPFMLKEHVGNPPLGCGYFRLWRSSLIVQPGFQEVRMGTLAGLSAGFLFGLFPFPREFWLDRMIHYLPLSIRLLWEQWG